MFWFETVVCFLSVHTPKLISGQVELRRERLAEYRAAHSFKAQLAAQHVARELPLVSMHAAAAAPTSADATAHERSHCHVEIPLQPARDGLPLTASAGDAYTTTCITTTTAEVSVFGFTSFTHPPLNLHVLRRRYHAVSCSATCGGAASTWARASSLAATFSCTLVRMLC